MCIKCETIDLGEVPPTPRLYVTRNVLKKISPLKGIQRTQIQTNSAVWDTRIQNIQTMDVDKLIYKF